MHKGVEADGLRDGVAEWWERTGRAAAEVERRRAAASGGRRRGPVVIWWKPLAPGDKVTRYLRQP